MANIRADYGDIEGLAARLRSGQEQLVQQLQALRLEVAQLVSSGFVTDSASGAFERAFDEFTAGATATVSGLEGLSAFLGAASDALRRTDAELGAALTR